jgi:hypothetical protein
MKLLIVFLFTLSSAYAQSLSEFLKMTDEQKIEFLDKKALFIDNQNQLNSYLKKAPSLQLMLNKIGNELSNVWGDTVLEGPYAQTGNDTTDLTGVYLFQGKVYAYSGSVSAAGVFIDDEGCEFDEDKNEWNENCSEVNIYENFYMDFTGKFIESDNYAEVDS